jgi:hypothetical protein
MLPYNPAPGWPGRVLSTSQGLRRDFGYGSKIDSLASIRWMKQLRIRFALVWGAVLVLRLGINAMPGHYGVGHSADLCIKKQQIFGLYKQPGGHHD